MSQQLTVTLRKQWLFTKIRKNHTNKSKKQKNYSCSEHTQKQKECASGTRTHTYTLCVRETLHEFTTSECRLFTTRQIMPREKSQKLKWAVFQDLHQIRSASTKGTTQTLQGSMGVWRYDTHRSFPKIWGPSASLSLHMASREAVYYSYSS